MLDPRSIIARKRDGEALDADAIGCFVDGVVDGSFKDYQATALLMAIVLRGMDQRETRDLTRAMLHSGDVFDWTEIGAPKIDKHSTGGVGDNISLVLAPLAAAAGLCVPMMSGRSLGHTGGTLDKLEAIPGFTVNLDRTALRRQLSTLHCAMIGPSESVAPADRVLYALRDVTATVESIPLICASILSKKLAEGIDGLVLDVKCGGGAFMQTRAEADALARALVGTLGALGKPAEAWITAMDEPLGRTVGNALEVREAIACLRGEGPRDVETLSLHLCSRMLLLGGLESSPVAASARARRALDSGAALERFAQLIEAQGGDARVVEQPQRLPTADQIVEIGLPKSGPGSGYVGAVDARAIAETIRVLGAGRRFEADRIDPAVGVADLVKVGDPVSRGDCLCRLHANGAGGVEQALVQLQSAFSIVATPPDRHVLLIDSITTTEGA